MQEDCQTEWPFVTMDVTIVSAQGLRSRTNFFCRRGVRPFATLSTNINRVKHLHVYRTKVDKYGGANPAWGDKFQVPVDKATFEYSNVIPSYIYVEVFTKRLVAGQSTLGWCQIPVTDIVDEFLPTDGVRQLSYQLRNRDGSRGQGVVNIEVKLTGLFHARFQRLQRPLTCSGGSPPQNVPETVIGIPVITKARAESFCPSSRCISWGYLKHKGAHYNSIDPIYVTPSISK